MRTIQFGILAFLILYILFCLHFFLFQGGDIDYRFIVYFLIPAPWILYDEITESNDSSPFLAKLNRTLQKEGMHARFPTNTEINIVKSFFDEKGWEMPLLFTGNSSVLTASIGRCFGKNYLLISEQIYWLFTPQEIWAILAHEWGHFANHDRILIMLLEKHILSPLSVWVSWCVLLKIFAYPLFFHSGLLYSPFFYCAILILIIYFLEAIKNKCEKVLDIATEILADNTAAQTVFLGSPVPILEALEHYQKFLTEEDAAFSYRISVLRWIEKKKPR
jgi:Zn-dependent protease with chaperone function